ncbi:MAG: TonB-dependent receptor domain-containing protein [Parcubacteria group bacterium]
MRYSASFPRARLMIGAAAAALMLGASPAFAEDISQFNLAPQSLASALYEFGRQTGRQVIFSPDLTKSKTSQGVSGSMDEQVAMAQLLAGTGLSFRHEGNTFMIVGADAPQSGSAAGDGAGTVEALVVTAQKKEEQIQDVPIAISAFTEKTLQEQKIEGGFDLLKAIPNVTFSKNNFTSYNFSIRGVGTKAVSATTDPGVAVSFNNISLIQNRLFEQEYFDVERVEVLRGPQGTLYGRNATAGVINVISAKPNMTEFSGWLKGEVGNYHSKRVSAMMNIPLWQDKLAVRVAGALTDRAGYDYNTITKHAINGRDLWSARITVGFNPTDNIRSNLIWERFNEDDDRSRTGKQLCHRDPGPAKIGSTPVEGGGPSSYPAEWRAYYNPLRSAIFSQSCKPGSLYEDAAFGTPNGLSLPFVWGAFAPNMNPAFDASGMPVGILNLTDPYGGMMQSRDMRTIASIRDPKYRAKADVVELNIEVDLPHNLTFSSQTAYDSDSVYSFQDYNRFNTKPIFNDLSQYYAGVATNWETQQNYGTGLGESPWAGMTRGGIFCDPQIGCSNSIAGFDISTAKAHQFTTELRLQSHSDGPLNFSTGANFTRFNVLADYYVFYNLITALAELYPFNTGPDITKCGFAGFMNQSGAGDVSDPNAACPYIDPNPIESINGEGHNYFRSKNPYKLTSSAAFGELYWQASEDLKVTAGLRYTDDRKRFTPVPSQLLLAPTIVAGGYVSRGYPELSPIKQKWGEWTGRLGVDWKPELGLTDQTMVYAFYSRGYKGGGANPPRPGFANVDQAVALALGSGLPQWIIDIFVEYKYLPTFPDMAVEYSSTFRPEFVNAFEVGAKNTLFGGAMTLNADTFFYDYKDYQVSQIRDRTAVNENFNAKIWGLELETVFAPSRNLRLIANVGYLDTAIGNGMYSIDTMNRTQGNPDYVVAKPWVQLPSNCIVPRAVVERYLQDWPGIQQAYNLCGGYRGLIWLFGNRVYDPATGQPYDPLAVGPDGKLLYPEINGGAGIKADLSGNELPNSPHWTVNLGGQYAHEVFGSWRATIRGDVYWQSQSWARVYNLDPYDKLHGWYNFNLSMWLENEDGLKVEVYAKNILDKTPITDAFLNSDDTGLTTNVFTLDPRLIGLSIKKDF